MTISSIDRTTAPNQDNEAVTAAVLERIQSLQPEITDRLEEFDNERRIPADVITSLKEIGVFDVLTPRVYGGLELGLLNSVRIIEAISEIDGSLGWATMIGVESPQILSLLKKPAYDELFSAPDRPLFGGTFLPAGEARMVPGGFQVSGRWGFASGCQNWDLLFGNCVVLDENGERRPGRVPGTPETRAMVFPASSATIEDTWRTLGMRGSGSQHFNCKDVFVPAEHSFDILFDRPSIDGVGKFPIAEFNTHIAAVILGTAQGAINDFISIAQTKKRMGQLVPAAKSPVVQYRVGQVQASINAARAYLHHESHWLSTLDGSEDFSTVTSTRTGPHNAWISATAVQAIDTIWSLSGAASAYEGSPIQRRLRDVSVARQHAAVTDTAYTQLGAALFGETHQVSQQTQTAPTASS